MYGVIVTSKKWSCTMRACRSWKTSFCTITGNLYKVGTGCVKMRCALLLAEGKQNVTSSSYFTQPGVHLLEIPCTVAMKKV